MKCSTIIQDSRAWFHSGVTLPVDFRIDSLRGLAGSIEAHETHLLDALEADLGKSRIEAFASESGYVLGDISYAIRHLKAWAKPRHKHTPLALQPGTSAVHPVPRGVVLIVGPWNYPFQLLFSPMVSAIAAGNCVCLKPSEFAPATAQVTKAIVKDGFDPKHVFVCEGDHETAAALVREDFDHIFFTGGTATGRKVMEAAAAGLTPVTLELGGKCPCIVCADAPIEVAARRIVRGKFMNAGQTCVAPDYVLVEESVKDRFVDQCAQTIREFYGDEPRTSPDYARIIGRRHFDQLVSYLQRSLIVCGGQTDAHSLYIAPTILSCPGPESAVMNEEIFGPILPIVGFDNINDAIHTLSRKPSPLVVYLFTGDGDIQRQVIEQTVSGGVCVNDTVNHLANRELPFGGIGESGMGAYHGRAGFDCFTHYRSIIVRGFRPDIRQTYPPYRLTFERFKKLYRMVFGG